MISQLEVSVFHRPLERWEEADLQELIDEAVPEGVTLDYKQAQEVLSAKSRREAAKDVSAFANTMGGRIIIGLTEDEREGRNVPCNFAPLTDDTLKDRLLDVLHSC